MYTCNYLLRSGQICGQICDQTSEKRCTKHLNAKERYPCKMCGVPTSAEPGLCRNHAKGYYVIQYFKRIREKALVFDQIHKVNEGNRG